jgi:hypothetical protein
MYPFMPASWFFITIPEHFGIRKYDNTNFLLLLKIAFTTQDHWDSTQMLGLIFFFYFCEE